MAKLGDAQVEITANTDKLRQGLNRARTGMKRFAKTAEGTGRRASRAFDKVSATLKRVAKRASDVGKKLTLRITAPVVAIGTVAVKQFADFEAAMRNVNVIAKESEEQFQKTTKTVFALAIEMGKQPLELANALFKINSAGFIGAKGLDVLRSSALVGVAGLTDTAAAADLVTSALSAFKLGTEEASDVADILFKLNERGKTDITELAASLGNVIPTAAGVGIQFDELAAAMATLTRNSIKTAEATTAMNGIFNAFLKPSEEMKVALKEVEAESGAAFIKAEGLAAAIGLIIAASDGSADAIGKLVPEIRGMRAAFVLTADGGKDLQSDLDLVGTKMARAGSAAAAMQEQSKALARDLAKLKAAATVLSIQFGAALAPIVRFLAKGLSALVAIFSKLSPSMKTSIAVVALLAAAVGPLILVFGLFAAVGAAGAVILGKLILVFSVIALVIGGVITAIKALAKRWKFFGDIVDKIKGKLKKPFEGVKKKIDEVKKSQMELANTTRKSIAEQIKQFQSMGVRLDNAKKKTKKLKEKNDELTGSFIGFTDAVKRAQEIAAKGGAAPGAAIAGAAGAIAGAPAAGVVALADRPGAVAGGKGIMDELISREELQKQVNERQLAQLKKQISQQQKTNKLLESINGGVKDQALFK